MSTRPGNTPRESGGRESNGESGNVPRKRLPWLGSDTTPPSILSFGVTNPQSQDARVTIETGEQLGGGNGDIAVPIDLDGANQVTLGRTDFSESQVGQDWQYEATYAVGSDGTVDATLNTAKDAAGNDGAGGEADTVEIDTTAPTISSFTATNPVSQDVQVSFDSDEQLGTISSDIDVEISGAESANLNRTDFSESGSGPYTYTATYVGSTDGDYTATLNAAREPDGNDGAGGETDTVTISTTTTQDAPIINATNLSASEIEVSGQTVSGGDTYEFQAADDEDFTQNVSMLQNTSSRRVVESGLSDGQKRYYRCRTVASDGTKGPWSLVRTATADAPTYPADTQPLATGISLRKLASSYSGSCLKAKRVSDGATTDIGFVGREVDIEALESFSNGGDVVIAEFYDQIESGTYTTGSSTLPKIVEDGSVLRDERTGYVYFNTRIDGTKQYFQRSSALSTAITIADSTPMLCFRREGESTNFGRSGGWGQSQSFTDVGTLGQQYDFFRNATGDPNFRETYLGTRQWISSPQRDGEQPVFCNAKQIQLESTSAASGSYSQPQLLLGGPYYMHEAVILRDGSTDTKYRNALWDLDEYWQASPTESQWNSRGNLDHQYRYQADVAEWLRSLTESDVSYPQVASATSSEIVVSDVDWTHLQSGDTIHVRGQSDFTLSSAPSLASGDTTLPVNEDASPVSVGDEIIFEPVYDGTYGTDEEVAERDLKLTYGGDSNAAFSNAGSQHWGWYTNNTGEPTLQPGWDDWAEVDESNPDTTNSQPNQIDVFWDGAHRAGYVKWDLSGLSQPPSVANIRAFIDTLGSDTDDNNVGLGMKVYENLSWDSTTLTWNNQPGAVDYTASPDFEDLLDSNEVPSYKLFPFTDQIQQAYENGSSSVTVVFYISNDYSRNVPIHTPTGANPAEAPLHQARGLSATDNLRLPSGNDGTRLFSAGRRMCHWSELSLPYNGADGNPFHQKDFMRYRGLVLDLVNGVEHHKTFAFGSTRAHGGQISTLADTLDMAGDLLPLEAYRAAKDTLLHMCQGDRYTPYNAGANSNMDVRSAAAMMHADKNFQSIEKWSRNVLQESARRTFFKDRQGTPLDDDSGQQIWKKEGNFYEGRTPEGSYNNRSFSHLIEGRVEAWGVTDWSWVDTMIERMAEFQEVQFGSQPGNDPLDVSGYSGRTTDAVLGGQWQGTTKTAIGTLYQTGRWWLNRWKSDGSFRVPDAPTLASDAQSKVNELGSMGPEESVPEIWDVYYGWNIPIPIVPPTDGWYSTVRQYNSNDNSDLYPKFHPKNTDGNFVRAYPPESGNEDWMAAKVGSDGSQLGFLVDVRREYGAYGGQWGGVQAMWSEDYGMVISTRKPQGKSGSDTMLAQTAWGIDDDDSNFAWHNGDQGQAADSVSVDTAAGTAQQKITYKDSDDPTVGDASWTLTRNYTVLDTQDGNAQDGLKIDVTFDYTEGAGGTDQIKGLFWRFPLNVVGSFDLFYWDGSAWVQHSPGAVSTATEWQIRQDVNGTTRKTWLRFGSDVTLTLTQAGSKQETTAHNLDVYLIGDGSTATDIPTTVTETLTITRTDPGFTGTAISTTYNAPAVNETFPETGWWTVQTEHSVPSGETLAKLWYRYSTDDGSTWTTLASLDVQNGGKASGFGDEGAGGTIVVDGSQYEYVGDDISIPSGLTDLQVVTERGNGTQREKVRAVSSSTTSTTLAEDFTAPDGTVLDSNYTLDTGGNIAGQLNQPFIQNNKQVGGDREYWWAPITNNGHSLVEAEFANLQTSGEPKVGFKLLSGNDSFNDVDVGVTGSYQMVISERGGGSVSDSISVDGSSTYVFKAQALAESDVVSFRVYQSDGTTLVGSLTDWSINRNGADYSGIWHQWDAEATIDNYTLEQW